MRFSEVIQLDNLRNNLVNLLEYTSNWEQYDPFCPQENEGKAKEVAEQVRELLKQVEQKMEELGSINIDSYGY